MQDLLHFIMVDTIIFRYPKHTLLASGVAGVALRLQPYDAFSWGFMGCFIRSCAGDHFILTPSVLNGAILSRISDCECLESAMGVFHDVTNSYISPPLFRDTRHFSQSERLTDFVLGTTAATSCVGKEQSFPKSFLLPLIAIVAISCTKRS